MSKKSKRPYRAPMQGVFACRSERLGMLWDRMNDLQRRHVLETHHGYVEMFTKAGKKAGESIPDIGGIAVAVHGLIDSEVARNRQSTKPTITCAKGCAHCCYLNVTITRPEAILLHVIAINDRIDIDYAKLERQAHTHDDAYKWMDMPVEDRACVFLDPDTKSCKVYEHRPTACRKHFSTEDPDKCDSVKHPGATVGYFVSPDAEIVASAELMAFEAGNMPDMLLATKPPDRLRPPADVLRMLDNPGHYLCTDSRHPGAEIPLVSKDGMVFSVNVHTLAIDELLDPGRFYETAMFMGPVPEAQWRDAVAGLIGAGAVDGNGR